MHVRDTGNRLYPLTATPPWPNYNGLQLGARLWRGLALETGVQGVSYNEMVPLERFHNGSGNALTALNVPLTAIWNFRPLRMKGRTFMQLSPLAGINFLSATGRNSWGETKTLGDRNIFYLDSYYRSDEGPAHFLRLYGGVRAEMIFNSRVGFYGSLNHILSGKEMFTNHVTYAENGVKNTGEVAYTGGGKLIQVGLRYYFGNKIVARRE